MLKSSGKTVPSYLICRKAIAPLSSSFEQCFIARSSSKSSLVQERIQPQFQTSTSTGGQWHRSPALGNGPPLGAA